MENFIGLAHIGLYTEDMKTSKNYYMKYFCAAVDTERHIEKEDGSTVEVAMLSIGTMVLELIEHSDKNLHKRGNGGCVDHFAISVRGLDSLIDTLGNAGMIFLTNQPVARRDADGLTRYIYTTGPSGESIELIEHSPA